MEEKLKETRKEIDHETIAHIFLISSGMVGVCLTAIGLMKILTTQLQISTLADDLLGFTAVLNMICCLAAFWSFRTRHKRRRGHLELFIELTFLLGLVMTAIACLMIVYTIA